MVPGENDHLWIRDRAGILVLQVLQRFAFDAFSDLRCVTLEPGTPPATPISSRGAASATGSSAHTSRLGSTTSAIRAGPRRASPNSYVPDKVCCHRKTRSPGRCNNPPPPGGGAARDCTLRPALELARERMQPTGHPMGTESVRPRTSLLDGRHERNGRGGCFESASGASISRPGAGAKRQGKSAGRCPNLRRWRVPRLGRFGGGVQCLSPRSVSRSSGFSP